MLDPVVVPQVAVRPPSAEARAAAGDEGAQTVEPTMNMARPEPPAAGGVGFSMRPPETFGSKAGEVRRVFGQVIGDDAPVVVFEVADGLHEGRPWLGDLFFPRS
jgi:hypothetical protein